MIAHHTVGGCNLRPGDLLGSGTVTGPQQHQRGCLLELTWAGQKPVQLHTSAAATASASTSLCHAAQASGDGGVHEGVHSGIGGSCGTGCGVTERVYLCDGDEVVLRGRCEAAAGVPGIGFGECRGKLLPCAYRPPAAC